MDQPAVSLPGVNGCTAAHQHGSSASDGRDEAERTSWEQYEVPVILMPLFTFHGLFQVLFYCNVTRAQLWFGDVMLFTEYYHLPERPHTHLLLGLVCGVLILPPYIL